jgi:glycosyltransferase involved in cell wall biosynthesis
MREFVTQAPRIRLGWLGHKSRTIGDGLRTYSREVTNGLSSRNVEILFVHHEESLADGRSSHSLAGNAMFQRRFTLAGTGALSKLEGLLREHEVDIVHVSAPFSTLDFRLPAVCHKLGIPIVVTYHVPFARELSGWGALAACVNRLYARPLSACDRVIVSGQAQRSLLLSLGVPDRVMVVMSNGVDTDKYSPGPSPALETLAADRLFSFMGRIDPEKQVDALLQAFLDSSPPPSLRLVIAGDGVDLVRLRRRYKDRRIVFLGAVLDEQLRIDILRASDAFFLPSRLEAFSFALLEAMACGVAVAATNVGNHSEALEGAGVLLSNSRLRDDLQSTIRMFIDTPARCRSLGARARERAAGQFSLKAYLDRLIALYGELAGHTSQQQTAPAAEGFIG